LAQYEYLILMAACVAITLPLEFLLRARVYRRLPLMLPSVGVVVVVFGLWDLLGIVRGHWTYNPEFITGIHLGPMPLEELVFFVVISLCALLSYEGVSTVLRFFANRKKHDERTTDAA
jgi:lycopene cyclase domain-containing protein